MTNPPDPEPTENFSDADAQWYARLTGHAPEAPNSDASQEADALRRALVLERQAQDHDPRLQRLMEPDVQETKRQALLFRLRSEGLVTPKRSRWLRWAVPIAGLAVAATLIFSVMLPLQQEATRVYYDEPPTMRGEIVIVEKTDDHPKQTIETLAAQLRTAGAQVLLYQRGAIFYADIDVPAERLAELTPALKAAGIKPRAGLVRVQISKL